MFSKVKTNLQLAFAVLIACLVVLLTRCQTSSLSATQTVQLGDQFNNQNRYAEAIIQYEKYLQSAPSLGIYRNPELESEVHRKVAHAYSTQGKYDISKFHLQKALDIDRDINNNVLGIIEDLRLLGTTHTYLGEYPQAIQFLEASLQQTAGMETSAKDARKQAVADTHISLAHVYIALGDFVQAFDRTESALPLYQQLSDDNLGLIETYLLKGNILIARNELERGLIFALESKKIAESNSLNTSRQLQSIAEAFELKGELENSLRTRLEALEEARKSNITPQIIWATLRIGDTYQKLGDMDRANQYYNDGLELQLSSETDTSALLPSIQMRMGEIEEARNFWSQSGSSLGAAIANLRLGESQLQSGKLEESFQYFNSAREIFQEIGSEEGLAKAQLGMTHHLIQSSENNRALDHLTQALTYTRQPDTQWQIWFQKGVSFENNNNIDSATNAYLKSIEIIESLRGSLSIDEFKSSYFEDKTIVYDRLISLLLQRGGRINYKGKQESAVNLAFLFNEKARSRTFLDMIGNKKINPKAEGDSAILDREQELRLTIQQLSQQLQRNDLKGWELNELTVRLGKAQEEHQSLLQEIKLKNPAYQTLVTIEPPELSELQAQLDEMTALVEYWVGSSAVVVWIITRDKIEFADLGVTKDQLNRNVSALRNAIRFNLGNDIEKALGLLYEQLITPINKAISPVQNIGFIPHGALHFLPFQALISPEGDYLISSKNLFVSPSSAVFYFSKQKSKSADVNLLSLALGDLTIGEHKPLPGTEAEVRQISQFYSLSESKYRDETTETYFKNEVDQYNQVHIATHGIFSRTHPMYSYLLMSPTEQDDGRLTVQEIMDLNFKSNLVTLSACETALGDIDDGDEVVGLSRAFLYAGTSSVVVSLWTVNDISTSILMTKFHQFLKEGHKPYVALSMAQREMLNPMLKLTNKDGNELSWDQSIKNALEVGYKFHQSPYYWAPFVLVGS